LKKTILIVDDEQDIRDVIKITLAEDGFKVLEAANGKAAIESAKQKKPDLIIMDIMMPGIDGLAASKIIKEDPETANIPIIILSAFLSEEKNKYVQGIAGFISKPFKPEDLIAEIQDILKETDRAIKSSHILIVDDDPDILDIITLSLKGNGFATDTAGDGEEALRKIDASVPSLIILDIEMPKMNGFELIKNLKQNSKFKHIPIVILTGTHITEEDRRHGLTLGASKYLTKPFSIESLIDEIEGMICK